MDAANTKNQAIPDIFSRMAWKLSGSSARTRTSNLVVNSHPLCRLSYRGINSGEVEAAPRFELGIKDLQSSALPLGYAAKQQMERKTGFEPATPTLARLCSTPELLPRPFSKFKSGGGTQNRTGDTRIFSPLLYHLSYPASFGVKWRGRRDSNSRPSA